MPSLANTLEATVKARVPATWKKALKAQAKAESKPGMAANEADGLRVALYEYFDRRGIKIDGSNGAATNGKARS
jgi:hypothetical protein